MLAMLCITFLVFTERPPLTLELYDNRIYFQDTTQAHSQRQKGIDIQGSTQQSEASTSAPKDQFIVVNEKDLDPKVFSLDQTNFTIDYFTSMPECTPISPDQVTFTLTTQLSLDRLWIMKHQCKRWPPPYTISIAIYLPPESPYRLRESIVKQLAQEFHCDLSRMHITLFQAATDFSTNHQYPVNLLRNLALGAISTTHAVYIDSDFLVSEGLHDQLINTARPVLAKDTKALVVVPAFDYISQCRKKGVQEQVLACLESEWEMVPKAQEDILNLLDRDDLPRVDRGFQTINGHNKYHGTTLYRKWARDQSTVIKIPCIASHTYEPYVAMRVCRDFPIFPEQFRGWGHNKVTWVKILLKKLGYRLWQLPKGFVMHLPHQKSDSRKFNENVSPPEVQQYLRWLQKLPVHPDSLPLCSQWEQENGDRDP